MDRAVFRRGARLAVRARHDAYEIRLELEAERERRLREAELANERIRKADNQDPFFGRFDARGWLVPVYAKGQTTPTYMLRWAGDDVPTSRSKRDDCGPPGGATAFRAGTSTGAGMPNDGVPAAT